MCYNFNIQPGLLKKLTWTKRKQDRHPGGKICARVWHLLRTYRGNQKLRKMTSPPVSILFSATCFGPITSHQQALNTDTDNRKIIHCLKKENPSLHSIHIHAFIRFYTCKMYFNAKNISFLQAACNVSVISVYI
jgi:hypothetical protein